MNPMPMRDRLLEFLDIPEALPADLREHLVAEADDRQWWRQTLDLHESLAALGDAEPPAEAVTATLAAADAAVERMHDRRRILAFPRWGRVLAGGATAAVVLLTVGLLFLMREQVRSRPPGPEPRRVVYYDYGLPETPAPVVERWGRFETELSLETDVAPFRVVVPQPAAAGTLSAYYQEDPQDW